MRRKKIEETFYFLQNKGHLRKKKDHLKQEQQ